MGLLFSAQFTGVAFSAAGDIFELKAPADRPIRIHEVLIGQTSDEGDAAAEMLLAQFKKATGTYTAGTGGTNPTKVGLNNAEAAAATLAANSTTPAAAGTGALSIFRSEPFNIQAGLQWMPPPEPQLVLAAGQALVVALEGPTDEITLHGTIVWEELGG